MTTLKFKILSSVFIALLGSSQGFSARAQVSDQPLVADPADFDFTPLLWTEATIAQSGSDQPQPVTGNEPVSVTPGESKAKEEGSLAKAAQNPIASLISLPIQWNSTPSTQWAPNVTIPSADPSLPPVRTNFKANQTQNVVNVQPVIPFKVSDGLTLVTRTIVPFISQPGPRGTSIQSLGDINPSVFFCANIEG